MKRSITAVIAAGGEGKRMGGPKQFIDLFGTPMVAVTCAAFERSPAVSEIVLVVAPDMVGEAEKMVKKQGLKKVSAVVPGGSTRQESVYNGLKTASGDGVMIHDGARPLVQTELISRLAGELSGSDAVICAVPVSDTVKEVSGKGAVVRTLERKGIWRAQTPQCFKKELIVRAHEEARKGGFTSTDDSSLVERIGGNVKVVMGSYENIKVTTPSDADLAKGIIKKRGSGQK